MNKKGQIWVETVIYTLIAFAMIGLVLGYAKPKIEELRDKTIIEQTISMIKDIDSTILYMGGPGNQRIIDLGLKKGNLIIDGERDLIYFEIESKHVYSEPGTPIYDGNLVIYTTPKGSYNLVNITRDYSEKYNITYKYEDTTKTVTESSNPYRMVLVNKGNQGGEKMVVDLEVN